MKASIIIRAYNAEGTVARAITSALAQNVSPEAYEVVVVDDGSTDGTASIVSSIRDARLRLVRQENKGLTGASNAGIKNARGDIVMFLDADDEALAEFAPLAINALASGAQYAYGDYFEEFEQKRMRAEPSDPFEAPGGAIAWQRRALVEEGGFGHDTIFPEYDTLLRTWGRWHGARIKGPVFIYHRSRKSFTGDGTRVRGSLLRLREKYPTLGKEIEKIRPYDL